MSAAAEELAARVIELEARYAFQEESLRVLNEALTQQQAQMGELERRFRQLLERVRAQGEVRPALSAEEEIPPHY